MEQTDMDDLLSKMVLKTPINKHMEARFWPANVPPAAAARPSATG
jgi:hypothetical protein